MAAAFVDKFRDLGLRHTFVVRQPLVRPCFFDRIEILALQVLDQRQRHHLAIVERTNNGGNVMQPGTLCGSPAAFSGNEFVPPVTLWTNDDRLDNPACSDRGGQLVKRGVIKMGPRLSFQRFDSRNRDIRHSAGRQCGIHSAIARDRLINSGQRLFAPRFTQKGAKSAPEALFPVDLAVAVRRKANDFGIAHAAFLCSGRRAMSSRAKVMYARLPMHAWS